MVKVTAEVQIIDHEDLGKNWGYVFTAIDNGNTFIKECWIGDKVLANREAQAAVRMTPEKAKLVLFGGKWIPNWDWYL